MTEKVIIGNAELWLGDCRAVLGAMPAQSVHCCVTSPPYFGLRDYGHADQIGLETTPDEYVAQLVEVFREVRRVLRDDGTLWLNLGDSYNGYMANQRGTGLETSRQHSRKYIEPGAGLRTGTLKNKDLIGIPWRVAFALQTDGWYLRQDIIWAKPNPMPESVTDRCTKSHEYLFLLAKSERYYFDARAIAEPAIYSGITGMDASGFKNPMNFAGKHAANPEIRGERKRGHARPHGGFNDKWDAMSKEEQCSGMRNKRSVWTVATRPFKDAHFATFPPALIEPCILAGCPEGGTVLDPFGGAGTTAVVAGEHGRSAILIELNGDYIDIARRRIEDAQRQQRMFA